MRAKRPEVLITLDGESAVPLYKQIYDELCHRILQGTLREGEKLPSIRSVVKDLNVSHATVERAYQQLALEGYVHPMPRSGFVVSHLDLDYFSQDEQGLQGLVDIRSMKLASEFHRECRFGDIARYNFAYTSLQPGSFPRRLWRKLYVEVFDQMSDSDLVTYYHRDEPCLLQEQLAEYLQRARGVRCSANQVIFQAGTEAAIAAIVQLIQKPGQPLELAHEEPGFDVVTAVARRFGAHMMALPSDGDGEEFLATLKAANPKPKLIFTTPSHQFPSGNMMPLDVRIELLQWAADNDAYIIEDDSCNEYRYETRAIPALQSLDRSDRVIYLCNFSKALSPGLRLAYFVLPPALLARWNKLFTFSWDSVPYTTRAVLGEFMSRGYWDSHLRRMVARNRKGHDALVAAFEQEFGNRVTLYGEDSGMHLFVEVHNNMTQEQLLASARAQDVNVYGTQRYYWTGNNVPENKVIVGFSSIELDDILPGVQALRRAWFPEQ